MHRLIPVLLVAAASSAGAAPEAWPVIGRQGVIQQVVVPAAQAKDRAAYTKQIDTFCEGRETCFVNFYTNSTGAAAAVPLPDAIAKEATATLRRSAKRGVEAFRWSCRMAMAEPDCF